MDNDNSHQNHTTCPSGSDASLATEQAAMNQHPYSHNGLHNYQPQHYYQQQQIQMMHHNYHHSNQPTAWQWTVAIPPPPPPPPVIASIIPSKSQLQQNQKKKSIDEVPKRRKRRWGPSTSEQLDVIKRKQEKEEEQLAVKSTADETILKKEEDNSTDEAIDAINALSKLESRWEAPQKKKKTRNRKRRKKRKSSPSNTNTAAQTNNLDADNMHNVWIDVEDVVKVLNPTQMTKVNAAKIQDDDKESEETKAVDFPPLKHDTKEDEKTHDVEQDLNARNTAELKSYADVLARALGNSTKNQSCSEAGSEMDISDEDESSVDTNSGLEMKVDILSPEAAKERSPGETKSTKGEGSIDNTKLEKEKLALKLAELKAKTKLANAKLRMAKQKKALGTVSKNTKDGRQIPPVGTGTQTKRFRHSSASNLSGLRDISALQNGSTLIVEDLPRSGSYELVRFIDSVYDLSNSEDDEHSDNEEIEYEPLTTGLVTLSTNDQSEKQSHQSLKQQLHLAKLRLEIKKKEQLLLEKKKKIPAVALPLPDESNTADLTAASKDCGDINADNGEPTISSEEKKAKLEQLRQRQKELKQMNDVSNLKNMIIRQRQLLHTQSHELTENSSQLENVVNDIATKEGFRDESNKRLEEMNHRKRIMEGMMLRATEKLMTARKALGELKKQRLTT